MRILLKRLSKSGWLNVPFLVYLGLLLLIYIWNVHQTIWKLAQVQRARKAVQEARWAYLTTLSRWTQASRESAIAKRVQPYGLRPLSTPPVVIPAR